MILWLMVRRVKILLGYGSKRRDRLHSLQDCLDKPQKKQCPSRIFFLLCVIGPVLYYYIFCYGGPDVKPDAYVKERLGEIDLYTEKMTNSQLVAYEKQMAQLRSTENPRKNQTELNLKGTLPSEPEDLPRCISRIKVQNLTVRTTKDENHQKTLDMIVMGGYYRPKDCRSRHKVGILVPYRERQHNLAIFLYNIHPFLIRQKLEYRIFVIEQNGTEPFNRGRLLNAGFLELRRMGDWPCVIVHDVDLLPVNDRVLYTCPAVPRHMCARVLQVRNPKFRSLFGGVAAMTATHFRAVNGYSNLYWGWGGEDNDMFWRLKASGLGLVRDSKKTSTYIALPHNNTQKKNPNRFRMLKTSMQRYKKDGLSNLQYKVMSYQIRHLYTHVLVDINPQRENGTWR